MGKVYPFPTKDRKKAKHGIYTGYSENNRYVQELMNILVETYEDKIEELKQYKKEISKLDGETFKSPKEVSKEVKRLVQLFSNYGIKCNYFKFFTKQNQEILYYTESAFVYVVKNQKIEQAEKLSIGEFICEFEGYPFSLSIDSEVLRIFDNQISRLNVTIETLKNTQI